MTKLSKVLFYLAKSSKEIITVDTLKNIGIPGIKAPKILSALAKSKLIHRVRRGIYTIEAPESVDIFKLSNFLFDGYLGFYSALLIYNWTEEYSFEVYVVTPNTSKSTTIGKHEIKAIALKEKAVGSCIHAGYVVSTRGKTVFDIFYKPEFAGGYSRVLKAIYHSDMKKKDWEEFLRFSLKFGSKSYRQRTGYLLNLLKENTGLRIPKIVLKNIKPKVLCTVRLGRGNGTFVKEWGIIDAISKNILSWWESGA